MNYKNWIKYLLSIIFSGIALFALFNFTIDPLWTFCHSNRFNNAQPGFNERQQKTNRAYFCGLKNYDSLLLGSSRVTYINQHDFKGMNVFNYASVSMYPIEYRGWINLAKKIKGNDFKNIIIGMDFWGSSNGSFAKKQMRETPKPSYYFNTTTSFLYRYKMLFSMDTMKKSIESIKHSKQLGTTDYTRDNVKQTIKISPTRKQNAINTQISIYNNAFYGEKVYHYNNKLKTYFNQLKKENPNSKFIIFTTPITSELFKLLIKNGRLNDYKKWLTQLVDSFGEIYHFMDINSITKNPDNFADLHHIYPEIGTILAKKITTKDKNLPKDFGIILNKKNLNQYFKKLDKELKTLYK